MSKCCGRPLITIMHLQMMPAGERHGARLYARASGQLGSQLTLSQGQMAFHTNKEQVHSEKLAYEEKPPSSIIYSTPPSYRLVVMMSLLFFVMANVVSAAAAISNTISSRSGRRAMRVLHEPSKRSSSPVQIGSDSPTG